MRLIALTIVSLLITLSASALDFRSLRIADPADTLKAEQLISLPGLADAGRGRRIAMLAEALKGAPRDEYYSTDSIASLRFNLSSFTPITFINTVAALSDVASASGAHTWRDVALALEKYSCRKGVDAGFSSLMWHISDWLVDNIYRGNAVELTGDYPGVIERTKSLDYLSRHRDKFAVLADSVVYDKVNMHEMGYRTHRVITLKKETINKKELLEDLRDGDIIVLNPGQDGIDIYIIGYAVKRDDGFHLIYMSPEENRIVETPENLQRFFKLKTKNFNGYRILRLK